MTRHIQDSSAGHQAAWSPVVGREEIVPASSAPAIVTYCCTGTAVLGMTKDICPLKEELFSSAENKRKASTEDLDQLNPHRRRKTAGWFFDSTRSVFKTPLEGITFKCNDLTGRLMSRLFIPK